MNSGISNHFLAISPNTLQVYQAPLEVVAGCRRLYLTKFKPVMYDIINRKALKLNSSTNRC